MVIMKNPCIDLDLTIVFPAGRKAGKYPQRHIAPDETICISDLVKGLDSSFVVRNDETVEDYHSYMNKHSLSYMNRRLNFVVTGFAIELNIYG